MGIDKILTSVETIQSEMHAMMEVISKDPRCKKLSYDSIKDVFFMMKIAELQEQVNKLENCCKK